MLPVLDTTNSVCVQTCAGELPDGYILHGVYAVRHELLLWLGGDCGRERDCVKNLSVFGLN